MNEKTAMAFANRNLRWMDSPTVKVLWIDVASRKVPPVATQILPADKMGGGERLGLGL